MRVLVVDDDDPGRYFVVAALRASGHETFEAPDGVEALELARADRPDIVISDILMPVMDGYRLCQEWRSDPRLAEIPFVFYSANYTDPADIRFARLIGADDFMTKPMDPTDLVGRLEKVHRELSEGGGSAEPESLDESVLLREYNERLVHKLEEQLSEMRISNEALTKAEQQVRQLIDTSPVAILVMDEEMHVQLWNPAAEKVFGWKRHEVLGAVCPLIGNDTESGCADLFKNPRPNGAPSVTTVLDREGVRLDVSISAAPFEGPDGPGILALLSDITEQTRTTRELEMTVEKLRATMDGTVRAIAKIVEVRDPYTAGHQERVSHLAGSIAHEMELDSDVEEGIRVAGLIHDIGKVYVPAEILTKPRRLTDAEFRIIKLHPEVAFDVLSGIDFPWPIADYVIQHHERLNGSGYPHGLSGDEILLGSKILCVADVVEAMSSHRPYKVASGIDAALAEIESNAGVLYDEDVAAACIRLFREREFELPSVAQITLS